MQAERDAKKRCTAEQTLREREVGLRHAQEMGNLAYAVTGPAGELLKWSETLPAMIGRDATAMPATTRAWLELVNLTQRPRPPVPTHASDEHE
jgi:hypothetical protein